MDPRCRGGGLRALPEPWVPPLRAEDADLGTDLGSRSEAACCPVPSASPRSPAPRRPRTSSARCCRGTAGAGTPPPRRTGARARRPRARVPAARPAGTAARVGRGSAAACSLPPWESQSDRTVSRGEATRGRAGAGASWQPYRASTGSHRPRSRAGTGRRRSPARCSRWQLGDTGFRRTRPRLCPRRMAISRRRAPWPPRGAGTLRSPPRAPRTGAVDAVAGVAGQALAGGVAPGAGQAARPLPRPAGVSPVLAGVGGCRDSGVSPVGQRGRGGDPERWGWHLRTHACPSSAGRYPLRHSHR